MREEEYKDSAWLGWPVEWVDNKVTPSGIRPGVKNPHVTCLYFPTVEGLFKDDLVEILKDLTFPRRYRLAGIGNPEAFGPEKDIPVLLLKANWYSDLQQCHMRISSALRDTSFKPATNYEFNPHITVDLRTMLAPPEQVIVRPLELWWRSDEPVPV